MTIYLPAASSESTMAVQPALQAAHQRPCDRAAASEQPILRVAAATVSYELTGAND